MADGLTYEVAVLAVDFVTARIAEDERIARAAIADDCDQDGGYEDAEWLTTKCLPRFADDAAKMVRTFAVPRRILRDVEAKRRHIARWRYIDSLIPGTDDRIVRNDLLSVRRAYVLVVTDDASTYADHPDFRSEWQETIDHGETTKESTDG